MARRAAKRVDELMAELENDPEYLALIAVQDRELGELERVWSAA
jgi:hypothetical protein